MTFVSPDIKTLIVKLDITGDEVPLKEVRPLVESYIEKFKGSESDVIHTVNCNVIVDTYRLYVALGKIPHYDLLFQIGDDFLMVNRMGDFTPGDRSLFHNQVRTKWK